MRFFPHQLAPPFPPDRGAVDPGIFWVKGVISLTQMGCNM